MQDDLRALLPQSKHDLDRARALVARGYPAVAPVLPELLEWLQDYNWPVAQALVPFLQTIGPPLLPELRRILGTNDEVWKYWVLWCLVRAAPTLAEALRPELTRLVESPTPGEATEEVDQIAREILEVLEGARG